MNTFKLGKWFMQDILNENNDLNLACENQKYLFNENASKLN